MCLAVSMCLLPYEYERSSEVMETLLAKVSLPTVFTKDSGDS